MTTTTTFTVSSTPSSKKDILERLFKAGQISFDELLILLDQYWPNVYTYIPDQNPQPSWTSTPDFQNGDPII
jgi:hypothetical protein